ncbi:MAG: phospholipid carrier-dependent glycosyltransferase, partial [Candidatus Omnitrophica bacterium]|nr:phospholipid carrier-dependent glycosyltransferase [Candidatus Omnitrophota bacterium]
HVLAYGGGDLNPHYFALPPLLSYILFIAYGLLFIAGRLAGIWSGTTEMALYFFRDPSLFYIVGRLIAGVLPGMINIYLTYLLARKTAGEKAALFASAVMAFCFLNVINSHYIYMDTPLVTAVLLTFIALEKLMEHPSRKNYVLAGACAGLAAGVKYNGIFLVLPCLIAHSRVIYGGEHNEGSLWGHFLSAAGAALFMIFLTNPFMFFSFEEFLASVSIQSGVFWYTGWTHHLLYSLKEGISMPLLIAGIAGLGILSGRPGTGRIMVISAVLYYLLLVFRSQHFARYVLPLIPFAAIGAGCLLFGTVSRISRFARGPVYAVIIPLLFLTPTAIKSMKADRLFISEDTRSIAVRWIQENIEKGSAIACDSTNFRPSIKQPYSQLEKKSKSLRSQPALTAAKEKKLGLMLAVADRDDAGYPLYFMSPVPDEEGQFLDTMPAIPFDIRTIRERGIKYVVINEQLTSPEKRQLIKVLQEKASVIKRISPYKDGEIRRPYDKTATTCIPVGSRELYSRAHTGPAMTIYRLR